MLTQLIQWIRSIVDYRESGQGLVEYALIIVLISVVSIAILSVLGTSVSSVFSQANAAL
jgi:pilus assembly protein Flp/PilA